MDTNNTSKIISDNLKRLMEEHEISNIELSEKIGVSQSTVGKWLLQKSVPRMGAIEKLADYFNVNKSDILENKPVAVMLPAHEYSLWPFTTGAGIADYEFSSESLEKISIPDQFLGKYAGRKDIIIFEVNGESMNRIIPNHSYVAVEYKNLDYIPQTGDVVVFRILGDGLGIKRYIDMYDEIMLKPESTDPVYTELRFNKNSADDLEILGKVVMYNVLLN